VKESDIQIDVVNWLKSKQSDYRMRFFSIPNEGQRKVWFLNKLVRMGLKSGVPDLVIEFPQGRMVYLEIKAEKGKLSETQQNWLKVSNVFKTPHYIIKGSLDANLSLLEGVLALFPDAKIKKAENSPLLPQEV
tara:strand:+ start:510 stop:908 length:399 start_codon:yes stop_codon:yes gene_type:complete